jgi:hypothetical protein
MPLRRRPFCMRSDACPSVDDVETSLWTPHMLPRPATADGNSSATHHRCKTISSAVTPLNHPHATTNFMKFRLCGQPLQSKLNQSSFTGYSQQTVLTVCMTQPSFHRLATSLIKRAFPRKSQTTHNFISLSYTVVIATSDSQVPASLC